MSNCKKFSTVVVDNIVPGRDGVITVNPLVAGAVRTSGTVWTSYTTDSTISGSAIVGGGIDNMGSSGTITLTLPSAAEVIAAFEDCGIVLTAGMGFWVMGANYFQNYINLISSPTIYHDSMPDGVNNKPVNPVRCFYMLFRVLNVTAGSQSMSVFTLNGGVSI